jgi:hypothetical protein
MSPQPGDPSDQRRGDRALGTATRTSTGSALRAQKQRVSFAAHLAVRPDSNRDLSTPDAACAATPTAWPLVVSVVRSRKLGLRLLAVQRSHPGIPVADRLRHLRVPRRASVVVAAVPLVMLASERAPSSLANVARVAARGARLGVTVCSGHPAIISWTSAKGLTSTARTWSASTS